MVRETRHLWVGNLPENIREDRIREHFKRYGPVQNVKLLPRPSAEETKGGEVTMACTVAFMDIKSAAKAHNASDLKIDERTLNTEYYEPAAAHFPSNVKSNAAAGPVTKGTPSGSPVGSTSPYSSTSFPNGHGSDEHSPFTTGGTTTAPPPSRLPPPPEQVSGSNSTSTGPAYQDSGSNSSSGSRGRNRENNRNSYRTTNGPSSLGGNSGGNRTPTTGGGGGGVGWSGYDTSRFNNSNSAAGNQSETTGYNSDCPPLERRNSDSQASTNASVGAARKKTGSKSRSPSPSGSASSRSQSRSRSRSSSSSSSSSTSRDTSTSTSSPRLRRHRSGKNHHGPAAQTDDKRPLAICVRNLPLRSSDTSLKDGLFHEYKKHGKVTRVKVSGTGSERYAIVCFKKPEDAEKALEVSYDKLFFGSKIEVEPYVICEVDESELRPYESEIDEYHPKATRTLFIGNLEKDVTASDLRKHFDQFGEIIEIDIKKQGAVSSYAFCQYSDIASVVKAIRKMDGEHLGNNRIKLGFGKSMAYNCVWVDGISDAVTEKYLRMQFDPFGSILRCLIDREKGQALIMYEHVVQAQLAVSKMRGFMLKNAKLQVDFASRECQECFLERLEKQGHILDRGFFEDRRDSSSRSFESAASSRIRYDTPTRPRTSSYSSRSSVAAIQSPGTPGSMTPRAGRTRVTRDYYYDVEYMASIPTERHMSHRSYDEYSQGSAASHEDPYELYDPHGPYLHDSPGHLDPLEYEFSHHRVIPDLVDGVPYPPQEIRHLQKERVQILEQLQDCPSSGDELISPKKRLKLDMLDPIITSDVIIEANRDHRKVMEVRRLSETSLRHHSRRPSIDAKYKDHMSSHYSPHTVGCKRRKTSDTSSSRTPLQHSHYVTTVVEHSDGSEAGGSRPGTPLCDEKPEFPQSEPRRVPRDRDGPLTLPLPKWAQSVPPRGSVSVAGIKGQKETVNILASPPPTSSSPRVSTNTRPTTPIQPVTPPASPPPRPPSLISNSSDSDAPSPGPSLEERIKSLDEKYEKWSGSRALSAAGGEALKAEGCIEKFRQRHKLLDLDLKEVQPSEIVKSVMAKRSVFDEDLKRLESVGEKYEPKEFCLFSNRLTALTAPAPAPAPAAASPAAVASSPTPVPVNNPVLVPQPLKLSTVTSQLPKTPTMLSPTSRATGSNIPAVKGLQYPFPSHPPIQMSPVPTLQTAPQQAVVTTVNTPATQTAVLPSQLSSSATTAPAPPSSTSAAARIANLGENNKLKPCASNPGDTRTNTSKVTVNNRITSSTQPKVNTNTPNASENNGVSTATSTCSRLKPGDKCADKIANRRDSNNSNSPRADVKTRRNSDTSARRIQDVEKYTDISDKPKPEDQKLAEKAKEEYERLEREKQEKERIENERIEKEKQEKERLERERIEKKERQERESELERQRLEKERLEKERLQKEKEEQERKKKLDVERQEKLRLEKEAAEKERLEKERLEKERLEKEKQEQERQKEETERKEREEKERRQKEERELKEKQERDQKEAERKEKEREERERQEKEKAEKAEKDKKREEEKERNRHKEDNHHDRKKEDSHSHKHRENHSDKSTKDSNKEDKSSSKESHHENHKRDSHNENSRHDKNKVHSDERRKESIKENKDNNIHEKYKHLTETKEHNRDRAVIESRHLSIDLDKHKTCDSLKDSSKRKERNNSLPIIGIKRRISSHEMVENSEEKRAKFCNEQKIEKTERNKISERRESRESSKSDDKSKKSKHKNNSTSHESSKLSTKDDKKTDEDKRKEKEREERHKKQKDKFKSKSKSKEKEDKEIKEQKDPKDFEESKNARESPVSQLQIDVPCDKDSYMAEFNLKPKEKIEEEKDRQRKEHREKEKQRKDSVEIKKDEKQEDNHQKELTSEQMKLFEENKLKNIEERKHQRIRKTNLSDSDSDGHIKKTHSIFDVVDDNPPYISMYDKVKARSCKNMQKHEEEKRQEKIKAKFSQLKMSRARREEKKRSTSWDEDSDSDNGLENKPRRRKKAFDSSDDSIERKSSKKRQDIYSDSDSSVMRQPKSEANETTDDEVKYSKHSFKFSKSRIASDTSEDDRAKLNNQIVSEDFHDKKNNLNTFKLFSESEADQSNAEDKLEKTTSIKQELERLIKKERRNSKFQEFSSTENQVSTECDVKEKYNCNRLFDNTSDDDNVEVKKDKSEKREKKHKKKQKKQKHSQIEELGTKDQESETVQGDVPEKSKHHEKRKDHSKKDKKRDKTREGREKSKKSKKNKSDGKLESKTEGKMENIFGSLSEDSDNASKTTSEIKVEQVCFGSDDNAQPPTMFTDSEKERDRIQDRMQEREEHKRRKEKRRREKERRLQEAAAEKAAAASEEPPGSNETSMDFIDMGKQLEANMLKDDSFQADESKEEVDTSVIKSTENFIYNEKLSECKKEKDERKEGKEKKKKRKKSKEEKSKHSQHHNHDKNKVDPSEDAKNTLNQIEIEIPKEDHKPINQSLLTPKLPSPVHMEKTTPTSDFITSPSIRESVSIISPIPKTPTTSKEKRCEKLLPGFGGKIDEALHENAVKSISAELEEPVKKLDETSVPESTKVEEKAPVVEDKPRVIISQEETEDAVAALLGESFGSNNSFSDEISTSVAEEPEPNLVEENTLDDEECRQAVQSLNAVADLDVKPDTPQSEHDLQIDTDTEEQDETTLPSEPVAATPEKVDYSRPPPTPDIQLFTPSPADKTPLSASYRTPINLSSPPSLTPIKQPQSHLAADSVKKNLNLEETRKSLPLLSESPQKSVIAETWSSERKPEVSRPSSIPAIVESKLQPGVSQPPASGPLIIKAYSAPPPLKINEPNYPPLTAISKLSPNIEKKVQVIPISQTSVKPPTIAQLHNLPARSPVQICKPVQEGMLSPKSPNMHLTRMPITSVMVTKPMQTTTVILPQPKVAQCVERPMLVSTSDPRIPEQRPRMVFQTAGVPPYTQFAPGQPPRMIVQGNIRNFPPAGLLVPSRHLTPAGYTTFVGNIPHSVYNSVPISREGQPPTTLPTSPIKQTIIVSRPSALSPSTHQHHPNIPNSVVPGLSMTTAQHTQPVIGSSCSMPLRPPYSNAPSAIVTQAASHSTFVSSASQMHSPKLIPGVSHNPAILSPRQPAPGQILNKPPTSEINIIERPVYIAPPAQIPSPVIKANPVADVLKPFDSQTPHAPITEPLKLEIPKIETPKVEKPMALESPSKLAIEKVTEELNISLKKEVEESKPVSKEEPITDSVEVKPDFKPEIKEEQKDVKVLETLVCKSEDKLETQKVIVSSVNDSLPPESKCDDTDTSLNVKENIITDITEMKDSLLDAKEDNDFWSAKDVNIESVIKTLCSADEYSDHESVKEKEIEKPVINESIIENKIEESSKETDTDRDDSKDLSTDDVEMQVSKPENTPTRGGTRGRGRGGSRGRGGKTKPVVEREGIQTRRGKLKQLSTTPPTPPKRGGRGTRGSRSERVVTKSESQSSDVYEFNDEEDNKQKERPRLVLTIKSTNPSTSNSQPTAIVKEITKDGAKEIGKEAKEIQVPKEIAKEVVAPTKAAASDAKEDFTSPQSTINTRKSRRLAEKDISKNTVDDTIEDVIKNSPQTRSAAKKNAGKQIAPNKTQNMPSPETPRKSNRGRKPRRASEATENSSSEESKDKDERAKSMEPPSPLPPSPSVKEIKEKEPEKGKEVPKEEDVPKPTLSANEIPKEKPIESLKAAMLRRIKGELTAAKAEPTNLIDPVTGLLIPMREAEEGKYIPLPGSQHPPQPPTTVNATEQSKTAVGDPVTPADASENVALKTANVVKTVVQTAPVTATASVIAQPITVVQQQPPKAHTLKSHVLSSQATKAVVTNAPAPIQTKPPPITATVAPQPSVPQQPPAATVISKPITSMTITKVTNPVSSGPVPTSQGLQIITTTVNLPAVSSPMSPRPGMSVAGVPLAKGQVKIPTLSPQQQIMLNQQKQFIQAQAGKTATSNIQMPKTHVSSPMTVQQTQIVNSQMAHMKHQQQTSSATVRPPGATVVISKAPVVRPPTLHQQQMLTAQVPTLPTKSQAAIGPNARVIQAPPGATTKGVMEPPKIDVNLSNVMLGRPSLSPQGAQTRLAGLPGYEASLHGDARAYLNRSRSPPPAHQNSPSPKTEGMMHFPPGPLRPPPDHYMHPTALLQYQQFLRQQMQQQHLQRAAGLDKTGEEGEEAPVGLALSGRGAAVPHSLHSPHDRATESPQMGQVYNTLPHTARVAPYSRYYDKAVAEPPPAHRPLTSHGSLAALPTDRGLTERGMSDRGMAHMTPLGTPDRPLSAHLQPDRPMSGHSVASAPHMGGMSATERMAAHLEQRPGMDRPGYIDRPIGIATMTSSMGAGLGAAGNLMGAVAKHLGGDAPANQRGVQAATPPHASQVPPQAESLFMLLKQYPLMWQGLLALKNDQAAVQMYFVSGNDNVAKCSLPKNTDGTTPPLRIFQRMRLEPPQVEGVARKMQMENEHCMLLALPCGKDHMDVLKQSNNLTSGFITYLQQKQAAGIVNVAAPGTTQPPAYVVHIFPSCDFVNENLRRIAPSLLERVADIAHLLIVITTV